MSAKLSGRTILWAINTILENTKLATVPTITIRDLSVLIHKLENKKTETNPKRMLIFLKPYKVDGINFKRGPTTPG
ncbi:hypothetical protein HOH45_00280 [bacterium]|nr:hypothetical protein [bacterium]